MRAMLAILIVTAACAEEEKPADPATAEREPIDRFAAGTGSRWVRTATNGLPGPNEAIDYDERFAVVGLGPRGEVVTQYDFDVQSQQPAPIYVFIAEGRTTPVVGQRNVVTVVPGVPGYNDLWQVVKVTVPEGYVANTVTSYEEIVAAGFPTVATEEVVNCPVVPEGSVARKRLPGDYAELTQGWYEGKIIQYFHFGERALRIDGGLVSPGTMFVTYNVNPGQAGGGAASGYMTEAGGAQTHNVIASLPDGAGYSPLWELQVYDNAAFATVEDWTTANAAAVVTADEAMVNSPVVAIE